MKILLFLPFLLVACCHESPEKQKPEVVATDSIVKETVKEEIITYPRVYASKSAVDSLYLFQDSSCYFTHHWVKKKYPHHPNPMLAYNLLLRHHFRQDTLVIETCINRSVNKKGEVHDDTSYVSFKIDGSELFYLENSSNGSLDPAMDTLVLAK